MPKISIIGSGNVGTTTALLLLLRTPADVVLVDIVEAVRGKALDLTQSRPILGFDGHVQGTTDCTAIAGSDLVIVTAGLARKPGMAREDLLEKNLSIVKGVSEKIKAFASEAVVIVVTNPLDLMAYAALKSTGFSRQRIIGMAGTLDTARFKAFLGDAAQADSRQVDATVLGSHGDEMVPLASHLSLGSKVPSISPDKIAAAMERTRNAGAEIVSYLKSGSAYYAPAAGIVELCEAILTDSGKILPASVYLDGEYGCHGIFLGVPVKLGREGVQEIVAVAMSTEEKKQLAASAQRIAQATLAVEKLLSTAP